MMTLSQEPFVVFLIGARINSWWGVFANFGQVFRFLRFGGPNFEQVKEKGAAEKFGCMGVREFGGFVDLLFGDGKYNNVICCNSNCNL